MNRQKTTRLQNIARFVLGSMLVFTGTGHLTWVRAEFLAQVPNWIPISADVVVVLSGIVEILLGLSLLLLVKQRTKIGWMVALFFVLIFPGNVAQYLNGTSAFGLNTDFAIGARLFFQPVLIIWALWSTGAWKAIRKN